MLNKDKRSILLATILGDGCLHETSQKGYWAITIDHGIKQADYIAWKAKLISEVLGQEIRIRQGHKGQSVQFSACNRKIRPWHKFVYKGGKKDISRILPFIRQPELALAIWLMDDGYVEPSISKLATGEKKNYGARFRIFTNSETMDAHEKIIKWFQDIFNITPKIHFVLRKKTGLKEPFLKINQADSLIIWEKIRSLVLQFKSMQYKFRYIEQIYQSKLAQPTPNES
jgi:hypothetical protein